MWLIASGGLRTRSTTLIAADVSGRYYAPQSKSAETVSGCTSMLTAFGAMRRAGCG